MNYEKLSKEISYALRHHPEKYGLKLDTDGWAPIDQLINSMSQNFPNLDKLDIAEMISTSLKKRHEISGDYIRAYYGHSNTQNISKTPCVPPDILYHGTTLENFSKIKLYGLKPLNRKFVHLSENIELAELVGKRKSKYPIILEINSYKAYYEKINFYNGNELTWLSDEIPFKYIRELKK